MHASFPPYGQDPQLKPSIPRNPQQPTGAYRSEPEMLESERKLRTALAYVAHARDLITEALKQPRGLDGEVSVRATLATIRAHYPKWDVRWLEQQTSRNTPPNCDGLSARDVRAPHPMASETLRAEDEFDRDHDASGV